MDVGDDSASGDGGLDKGVKLFVSADGELKMPTRVVRGAAKLVRSGRRSGSRRGARGESRRGAVSGGRLRRNGAKEPSTSKRLQYNYTKAKS